MASSLCVRKTGNRNSHVNDTLHALQVNAQGEKKIAAVLDDGRRFEGDLLIGADGIWSKVRHQCTFRQSRLLAVIDATDAYV